MLVDTDSDHIWKLDPTVRKLKAHAQFVAKEPWLFNVEGNPTYCLFRFMTPRIPWNAPYVAIDIFVPIDIKHCFIDGLDGLQLFDRPNKDVWYDIMVESVKKPGGSKSLNDFKLVSVEYGGIHCPAQDRFHYDYIFKGNFGRELAVCSNARIAMLETSNPYFQIKFKRYDEWEGKWDPK